MFPLLLWRVPKHVELQLLSLKVFGAGGHPYVKITLCNTLSRSRVCVLRPGGQATVIEAAIFKVKFIIVFSF